MHPILFHIPLPKYAMHIGWLVLAAAALALIFAAYTWFVQKDKTGALVAGGVGITLVLARLGLKFVLRSVVGRESDTWDMGPIAIYSYGVMLGLSLVVGWYLTLGLAQRDGLPKETMANNYVVTAIAAIVGSRVLYILTNLSEFNTLGDMFAMRKGGLVAYGGFIGGLAGSYFFLRRHKIPLLPWADVAVPSLASGLMITRIGCYLFGCDFGQPLKETAPAFLKKLGTFPHWPEKTLDHGSGSPAWVQHVQKNMISPTDEHSLPVHPTQIYESLVGLSLLILLLVTRRHQKFRGQIFFVFVFAYGVCRYLLEILRDDAERGSIPPALPEHVLIPLGLVILAVGYLIGFSKAIQNVTIQRATQVAAFVPAIVVYVVMKPDTFASAATTQFSTSQFIAITSGFAAAAAFAVFHKAALAHPKQAMALNLPTPAPAGGPAAAGGADDEDDDDGEEEVRPRKPERKAGGSPKGKIIKAKAKPAPKRVVEDEDDGEEAPSPKASKDDGDDDAGKTDEAKGESEEAAPAKAKRKATPDEG